MGGSGHSRARRRHSLPLSLPLSLSLLLLLSLPAAHCLVEASGGTQKLSPFKASGSETAWVPIGTQDSSTKQTDFTQRDASIAVQIDIPGKEASSKLSLEQGVGLRLWGKTGTDRRVDSLRGSTVKSRADSPIDSTQKGRADSLIGSTVNSRAYSQIASAVKSRADSEVRSGVRAVLSEVGLRYAKDVMVTQVLNEIIPLTVPDLAIDMMTPLGPITVNLSNIVLWNATVPDSALLLDEDSGSITLYAGNADANLSASWSFSFDAYLKDHGNATVDMEGLHVVAVGNLTELEGGLVVGVEEVGCAIDRLQISLHSPYSWIYNWLEARLPNHLRAAVQSQVEWSVRTIVEELNEFLQELPRAIPVDCSSDLDVTVPHDPIIKNGALLLDCSGQFEESNASCATPGASAGRSMSSAHQESHRWDEGGLLLPTNGGTRGLSLLGPALGSEGLTGRSGGGKWRGGGGTGTTVARGARVLSELSLSAQPGGKVSNDAGGALSTKPKGGLASCPGPPRMLTLKVFQEVIDSAIQVYYEAGALSFTLRKLPSSFPFQLNTRSWRYLLPSLYRQYPNTDMQLAFVAASVPNVTLSPAEGIDAAVAASFFLSVVLDEGQKDVLCIDIALQFSALAALRGNNLTALARLADISVDLRWSTVGSISPTLLEGITRTLTKIVLLPLLNFRLADGFPLPSLPGVAFCNACVVYHSSFLEICTDLQYTGGIFGLPPAGAGA